jgi:hypothetical protein
VRIDDVGQATTNLEEARASANEVGADWVVYGSFTRFGEGASLDLKAASTAKDGVSAGRSIFTQSGTLGTIIPELDEVSTKIVQYVTTHDPSTPAVSAGPAAASSGGSAELDLLRQRVERLEEVIYGRQPGAPVPEVELGGGEPAVEPES